MAEASPETHQRAKQLFVAAIECDPHERHSFIVDACGGDTVLREEVESLLDHYAQAEAEGFLGRAGKQTGHHDTASFAHSLEATRDLKDEHSRAVKVPDPANPPTKIGR